MAPSNPPGSQRAATDTSNNDLTRRSTGAPRRCAIGLGRTHARTPILMLINGLDIRSIHATHRPAHPRADPQPSRGFINLAASARIDRPVVVVANRLGPRLETWKM